MTVFIINRTVSEKMDTKTDEKSNNGEFYLLIIVIKLSILMAAKIGQVLVNLYGAHNKRIINKHNKTSIAKLEKSSKKNPSEAEAVV